MYLGGAIGLVSGLFGYIQRNPMQADIMGLRGDQPPGARMDTLSKKISLTGICGRPVMAIAVAAPRQSIRLR